MSALIRYRRDDEGKLHRVVLNEGHEGYMVSWTDSCTGCFEFNEGWGLQHYNKDPKLDIYLGAGCSECGFTGKRRCSMWVPFDIEAWDRHANRDLYEEQERRAEARVEGLQVMP